MKYHNLRSFQKHLASAAPEHLCRCYLIAIPDDYERAKAIGAIRSYLSSSEATECLAKCEEKPNLQSQALRPGCSLAAQPIVFNGAEGSVRAIADALLSPTLFGGEPVVLVDEAEKMDKKELQAFSDLVGNMRLYGYLLCGQRSKTILNASFEKGGVVLDLTEEKPWDKEKRLAEQLFERAANGGKRLAADAAPLLFERLGFDAALLDAELDKLICYAGDRPTIERSDIFRISPHSRTQTLWMAAEEIVWEGGSPSLDAGSFHGLIPTLRSQLTLGMKIASLAASQTPREEWSAHLPKIWPKTLEKRSAQAIKLGVSYFQKGLDLLFEIELLSRTGQTNEAALLDLFRCSLGR